MRRSLPSIGRQRTEDVLPAVLHVLTCDALAGTELMTATLIENLDSSRVDCRLVTLAPPGPIARRLRRGGIEVRSLGDRGLLTAFVRLARVLRSEHYDVVNAYGIKSTTVTRLLVALLSPGTRFVCGVRAQMPVEAAPDGSVKLRIALLLERIGSPLVHVYDSNSRAALDNLAAMGIKRTKFRYIPNGIDVSAWPQRPPTRPRPPVIACAARFTPHKGQADLVTAAALLAEQGSEFRVVLAGDGPTRADVERTVRERGLGDLVSLPGSLAGDSLRDLYAQTEVFCLASASEGMPGSVMEAMATGIPVVGTDVPGIRELVDDGRTGLLMPPRTPAALAAALTALLQDPERAERLGLAGRVKVASEFGLERMVAEKERLYRELVGQA